MASIWKWVETYLDAHADPHDNERAFLDTSFPAGESVVVVSVDDQEVDEDDPENVDDDGVDEDHHYFPFVALDETNLLQGSSMRCMRRETQASCSLLFRDIRWLPPQLPVRKGMARS